MQITIADFNTTRTYHFEANEKDNYPTAEHLGFDTLQMAAIPKMLFDSRECDVTWQRPDCDTVKWWNHGAMCFFETIVIGLTKWLALKNMLIWVETPEIRNVKHRSSRVRLPCSSKRCIERWLDWLWTTCTLNCFNAYLPASQNRVFWQT